MTEIESVARKKCGTYGGYQAHKRHKEEPCDPCRLANNAYRREYLKRRDGYTRSDRMQATARARALAQLADEYPERFRLLYDDELAKVLPEIEKLRHPTRLRKPTDERNPSDE